MTVPAIYRAVGKLGIRRMARDALALFRGTLAVVRSRQNVSAGLPTAAVSIGGHLARFDDGRYAYLLTKYLSLAGYAVAVHATPSVLAGVGACKFTRMIVAIPNVRFTVGGLKDHKLLVTEDEQSPLSGQGAVAILKFGTLLTVEAPRQYDLLFPYTMHPVYYHQGMHEVVAALRSTQRRMRLVFSGNNAPHYANRELCERFGKLSRPDVLQNAVDALSEPQTCRVRTREELGRVQAQGFPGFVHVENRAGFRVPKESWLEFLSRAEFFLACPGLVIPLAHNMVEAMSVGAIPITESPEFFDPPLQDGVNCIAFSGARDLAQKVHWVVETASVDDIAALREGVVRYYEGYLTPTAFGRRLSALRPTNVIGMNFID